eukprot:scaffold326_cov165-Amphora_coffeaeformis.AAC.5
MRACANARGTCTTSGQLQAANGRTVRGLGNCVKAVTPSKSSNKPAVKRKLSVCKTPKDHTNCAMSLLRGGSRSFPGFCNRCAASDATASKRSSDASEHDHP